MIQSFDWLTLTEVHLLEPTWLLVALAGAMPSPARAGR